MGAYRARSKGVQWSAQLLAECSGWLKCDKAKLKSTAGKELTFWFSARGMVRCKFYRQPKDRGQWPTQVAIQLCCETWRSSSCFPHPRVEVRSSVHSGEKVRRAQRISLHKRNGRGRRDWRSAVEQHCNAARGFRAPSTSTRERMMKKTPHSIEWKNRGASTTTECTPMGVASLSKEKYGHPVWAG